MYEVLTNATVNGKALYGRPNGPYGVAKCINWRDQGQPFTAIRWSK